MIVTVTLNPAIDQTLVVPRFVPGDTIRIKSSRLDPGGKGINVSRVIKELGGESVATGFAAGGLGRYIEGTLESVGIETGFVHTHGEARTNITILDETRHEHTILSEPGPRTEAAFASALRRQLSDRLRAGDWLVLAGSIPPPLPPSVYTEMIREANEIGVHTVLDADGAALSAGAEAFPQILKGNRSELERMLDRPLDDEPSTLQAALDVQKTGIETVVVTRGRHGAVAVTGNEPPLRGIAPKVRAMSPVGSGDALLAGFVLTLSQGGTMEEALRLGIAAGTAAVLTQGTELCHRREVDILLPRVKVQEITLDPAPSLA